MEVSQAAGSGGVAVVVLGWRLHLHERGRGDRRHQEAGRPVLDLYFSHDPASYLTGVRCDFGGS